MQEFSLKIFSALEPYLQRLEGRSGIQIDLYDSVLINGCHIDELEREMLIARSDFENGAESFEVETGVEVLANGVERPMRCRVSRAELVEFIDNLIRILRRAIASEGQILFVGD